MSKYGGDALSDGTTIHQWQFHGGNSQKWIFKHQGDGFYTIKSANATAGYYLGVIDDEVVVNSDIVLRDDEITGGMEWNVSVTNSGAFKLTAKKGYSLGYALATTTSDPTNGAKLVHGAYVNNDSYRDEWYLHEENYFTYALTDEFGFTESQASVLEDMYYRVRDAYPNEGNLMIAWRYSRLLGGIYYDHTLNSLGDWAWSDIAGNPYSGSEENYYTNTLEYSDSEYVSLRNMVLTQHSTANSNNEVSDFAHFNMSISARLAYELNKDGLLSNIALGVDLEVSYMAGWLGDAVIHDGEDNSIIFKNDDYKADLDAENVFQLVLTDTSYISAINSYYFELYSYNETRAEVFLRYIPLDIVKYLIFNKLIPQQYDSESDLFKLEYIKPYSPDTYNFIWSLINREHNMENHI